MKCRKMYDEYVIPQDLDIKNMYATADVYFLFHRFGNR